jgi:hypothetical protein
MNNVNSLGNVIIERESSEVEIEVYKQNQAQQRVVSNVDSKIHGSIFV